MKKAVFEGACTAIVTPFQKGKVDYETMKKLLDYQINAGIQAVVLCGTTGESATLSNTEHEEIFNVCTEYVNKRMAVICGIGSNNTQQALNRAKEAEDAHADAVLMVTPYYNKTTQIGLIRHFYYVADRISIPVIVYNIPGRTGIGIEQKTYIELSKHPNINGVKEASGNLAAFAQCIAKCGNSLNFWSGNDSDTLAMMAHGAKGVISVASNLLPEVIVKLCRLCLDGKYSEAVVWYNQFSNLFAKLFIEVNPIPIKAAMSMAGLCSDEMRLPLCPISEENRAILQSALTQISK